ncbi:hypothetical protein SAMN04488065_1670 [Haloplanus vescus]|uniref:DUF7991 domain-containing protein n=1 Tax=Haloplanus vescus TaxID=555874 RepID=A0A1H3Y6M6_9EURY|nr:hypothetical protein [Haloplanus vescus]SEA06761.1 hypothetical protein SAMN04488065_1670 [Haloplanus vescus]
MATILDVGLMAVVFGANTVLAAVLTRFFRLKLHTQWGSALYTAFIVPVVLVVTTITTFSLGVGIDLGSTAAVLGLMIGLPMALGVSIDVLYVTPPEEYELPETTD